MSKHRKILITAGPTHEPIDEVRYVANRSSGRMGVALAEAANQAGYEVILLCGPVEVEVEFLNKERPWSICHFRTTEQLAGLLDEHFPECEVLIMAAAVADYRPVASASGKLPRKQERLVIELEPTPDLVAGCAKRKRADQRIVAFALEESASLEERALQKMRAKGVDAIVANPLETMGSVGVKGTLYTADGRKAAPKRLLSDKHDFARWLIDWVSREL